jgi:uncharacterized protein YecE (DUF72 family)
MHVSAHASLRVGCSGWNYPHWRGRFYPEGLPERSWLAFYAERFDTVEVNATFYRLPTRAAVAAWAAQTPDSFVFAVKASRYLTHVRRLREIGDGVELMMERLEPLREAGKLGPLLWQLPPNLARDDERLGDALRRLPAGRNAFEFRHPSWRSPEVLELLREHDVALTIADRKGLPEPELRLTAPFCYVRFHHGRRGRRGNYSDQELARWRRRLAQVQADPVYVYFNNDWEGFALENALALRGGRRRRGTRPLRHRTIRA